MRALSNDIRFALRTFAKGPGATAVAILSLAIAIGPNSMLFSLFNRLVFQGTQVAEPDRLVRLNFRSERGWEWLSYSDYLELRRQSRTASGILAYEKRLAFWSTGGQRELLPLNVVSENYFSTLGIQAETGRCLLPARDERIEGDPPVVISHSLWQRRFASDPGAIGQTMLLNGSAFRIVGVAARGFRGIESMLPNDLWVPFSAAAALDPAMAALLFRPDYRVMQLMARLRPEVRNPQAVAEFSAFGAAAVGARPGTGKNTTALLQQHDEAGRGPAVLGGIVLSVVSLVLLIACANVAGIRLAQGEARRREIAVRLALGAGRGRLVRQLLVEGLLISLAAGGLALLMASWLVELLPALIPPPLNMFSYEMGLDRRVVLYTVLLTLGATLAFGLAPALRASRPDILPALKGDWAHGRSRLFSMRGMLVVGQIAVAQFLLAGAGLLLRNYFEHQAIRPGFDTQRNLLLITMVAERPGVAGDFKALASELRALPGVRRVSYSKRLPLSGSGASTREVTVPGVTDTPLPAGWNSVGPEFFSVMGTRIVRGRGFDSRDSAATALVNETMARRLWGSPDAAPGRSFKADGADFEVVGVVEDGKYRSLTESPAPYMFLADPRGVTGEGSLIVETAGDPGAIVPVIRKTLAAAGPRLTIFTLSTLRQHLSYALFAPRMAAGLVATVGLLGMFLASIGLYAAISWFVNRRAHEIGVRVALGAQPRQVQTLVLGQAARLAAVGAAIGLAAAMAAARVASTALYNVTAFDWTAFLGAAALVAAVALLAAYAPVRRALRLHPMAVLRQE